MEPLGRTTEKSVPVPASATVCGEPAALSLMVRLPDALPAVLGAKLTVIAQFPPAATLEPQVLLWVKSPLMLTLAIVSAALPEFVSVIVCVALVVDTC